MTAPSAIVLGGGHSRRYGRDKLTAPWSDSTLLARVVGALPADRHEVLLVVREGQLDGRFDGVDRLVADDPSLPEGPLRGLVAGLRASRSPWNWALGCDLPCLRTSMLELLRSRIDDHVDAIVFGHDGHAEPLVAMYARTCLPGFTAALDDGDVALRHALRRVRTAWIEDAAWRHLDPDGETFLNVNTPDVARRLGGTEEPR